MFSHVPAVTIVSTVYFFSYANFSLITNRFLHNNSFRHVLASVQFNNLFPETSFS
jgi:hypothetical protein